MKFKGRIEKRCSDVPALSRKRFPRAHESAEAKAGGNLLSFSAMGRHRVGRERCAYESCRSTQGYRRGYVQVRGLDRAQLSLLDSSRRKTNKTPGVLLSSLYSTLHSTGAQTRVKNDRDALRRSGKSERIFVAKIPRPGRAHLLDEDDSVGTQPADSRTKTVPTVLGKASV